MTEMHKMSLTARVIRIDNDFVRIPLFMVLFPFNVLDFAARLAWNAPRRFFRPEPWALVADLWLAGGSGRFVERED